MQSTILARDVVQIDLLQIVRQPKAVWVVLQASPDVPGSVIVEQQGYIDHEHKKVVVTGSDSKPMVKGRFEILSALTQPPQQTKGQYRWESFSEAGDYARVVGSPNKDRHFIDGAVLVCRLNDNLQGRERFEEAHSIPVQWKDFVKPAIEFYRSNVELLDAKQAAQNEVRLRELLTNPNPLTAIAACKVLSEANLLNAEFAQSALAQARGLRQAVFAMLLTGSPLQLTTDKKRSGPFYLNAELAPQAETLAQTATISSLKNLALGVYSAGVSTAYDPFKQGERVPLPGFGPTLLRAISQRTRELNLVKPQSQDERDLLSILQKVGLPSQTK